MSVTVDVSEIRALQAMLAQAETKVATGMPGVLDDVAESVAAQAAANAPVASGDLKGSIGVLRRSGNATARTRWVGSPLKQGFFQEFGTSKHPPQPWLNPAADAGVQRLHDELGELGEIW